MYYGWGIEPYVYQKKWEMQQEQERVEEQISKNPFLPSKLKTHPTKKMLALVYHGKDDVRMEEVPMPMITDPTDAIVRVTASSICGSDLHLYHGELSAIKKGDILGHESVGIIEEVGQDVKNFKVGDRVVISAVIACGRCDFCKRQEWSCCDNVNENKVQEKLYGHSTGALFGFTDIYGGYEGCQAEFVRVPYGDVNLFKIPESVSDSKAVMVADVACAGFHGVELADVKAGDKVVVYGCGPIGLMVQMWAKFRGAHPVVAIDIDQRRLEFANKKFGSEIINPKYGDPVKAVYDLIPGGPDKVIDCVGFHLSGSFVHKVERTLKLESDSPDILNAAIQMVRKAGRITLIGGYAGYANHVNVGALMEKHLTINGGHLWPQKYQAQVFEHIVKGDVDPTVILTDMFPLSKIDVAYKKLTSHEDCVIKTLIVADNLTGTSKSL